VNDTIYLKLDRNNEVSDRNVTIGDVASIYCHDTSVVSRLKTIKIMTIPNDTKGALTIGKRRYSVSAVKVIELIHGEYPHASVENIGESDFVIDYIDEKNRNHALASALDIIKTAIICVIVFFGSAYAIMAYNNDVGTPEIFQKVYGLITGDEDTDARLMEIMYSIGLTGGIVVFYNHFGGKSFSNDPTPIEVEMNTYEQDIDNALIERAGRSGKEIDVK